MLYLSFFVVLFLFLYFFIKEHSSLVVDECSFCGKYFLEKYLSLWERRGRIPRLVCPYCEDEARRRGFHFVRKIGAT